MKYVLIDPRKGFQIAYVGTTTKSLEERNDGHKKDFNNAIKSPIERYSLLVRANYKMNHSFTSKEKWFNEMNFHDTTYECFSIDPHDKYSESAWVNAFDKYFHMTNNKADVTRARNHQPIGIDKICKSQVLKKDFDKVLDIITKKIPHLTTNEKISITEYSMMGHGRNSNEIAYNYEIRTYLPSSLNQNEAFQFKKEYLKIHDTIENDNNYNSCPDIAIIDFELYKLDTPAKIAIIRDYFNNDLYSPFLNQDIFTDEEEEYFIDNLEILFKNNIFPKKANLKDLKQKIEDFDKDKVQFLQNLIRVQEILG